ncbi:hypothetical protein EG328_002456 [Venturia inaequalis]|uniref:RING-type domain-containing protein n=1 Tax=Venturia inaequalis TaxID=5025 RepID=A0A8H3UWJ9_VENIN|nr:hypothetical protein EG328_002456 [Venturia inaequalis]
MDREERLVMTEIATPVETGETVVTAQAVHDQMDNTPAPNAIPGRESDEDGSEQEQEVELSPEGAELPAMRMVEEVVEGQDALSQTEDSATAAGKNDAQAVADLNDLQFGTQECYICTDDVCHSKVLQLGCGDHWLCRDCIADPFEQAIQQESCYPPRCCDLTGPLEIEDFAHLLTISHPDLTARYNAKLQEYHMDKRFRRYCASDECKTFLSPESYERDEEHGITTADCPTCQRATCVFCTKIVSKAGSHECEPPVLKLNEDYSPEARFKYCPFCKCPGLLEDGCNHVTCECGESWCFICLRKWDGGYHHEECGQYNDPIYDSKGYDENGFHRDTGVDRQGFNRDGFNVAGFDREGNKVTDFARLERDRLHAPAPRPAGFLDLDEENFEETAMVMFISEREAGIVHETDNFEELLAIRFPGFRRVHHAHDDEEDEDEDEDDDNDGQVEDNDNHDEDEDGWADDLGQGNINNDEVDQAGGLANLGHAPAAMVVDTGVDEQDDEAGLDAEADSNQPQPPTATQIQCQHNWDLTNPGNICKACNWVCEDYAMVCTTCNVEACGECAQNFAGNVTLNWPGADIVGGVEGGDQNGDADVVGGFEGADRW